jgi:hypothetical protein
LREACQYLNIKDKDIEYFGLKYFDFEGNQLVYNKLIVKKTSKYLKNLKNFLISIIKQQHWIDTNRTVSSQFKNYIKKPTDNEYNDIDEQIDIDLIVKFYPTDPCQIKSEMTRYLLYLQLKRDIINNRLPLQFDVAVELFAYFLQAEQGEFNKTRDTPPGFSSQYNFMPKQTPQIEKAAEAKYSRLKQMSQSTAEMNFLNKAKWLDMYGVDMHSVMGNHKKEYNIGLTPTGIVLYQYETKINNYFWPRINKVECKHDKFMLTLIDHKTNEEKTEVFMLRSKKSCKHLYKCCVDYKRFFKLQTVYKKPAQLKTSVVMSKRSDDDDDHKMNNNKFKIERVLAPKGPRKEWPSTFKMNESDDNDNNNKTKTATLKVKEITDIAFGNDDKKTAKKSPTLSTKSSRSISKSKRDNTNEVAVQRRRSNRSGYKVNLENGENHQEERQRRRHSHSRQPSNVSRRSSVNKRNQGDINLTDDEQEDDDDDEDDREKKRQIRRRRRSKSPGATSIGHNRLPDEILKHINYNLVEPSANFDANQLREIPFVQVETKALPFRISPHQVRHKRGVSPNRARSRRDSKSSLQFFKSDNNKTSNSDNDTNSNKENKEQQLKLPILVQQKVDKISTGAARNIKLNKFDPTTTKTTTVLASSVGNTATSADSGCEDILATAATYQKNINHILTAKSNYL